MITSKGVRLVAVALTVALVPAAVVAQHHGMPPGRGHDMSGMHERILDRLELTEEQRAAVDALREQDGETLRSASEALREARAALAEAIHAVELDETAIRESAATVGEREGDLAVARAQHFQQFRAILTSDQLEELESIRETMRMLHAEGGEGLRMRHD